MTNEFITIKGAKQNNLKNLDLELPTNELVVVTGVSGSGKSTLAFDTIYAEGQRRYIETFSAYARQFLDRMDKPMVDEILGIPPAIAIDQTNPVRTSRSTVGTMTELNDYLKLLFSRFASLHCYQCGREVSQDSSQSIVQKLYEQLPDQQRIMVCLKVKMPENLSDEEVLQLLSQQGYTRIHKREKGAVEVVQDRLILRRDQASRLTESIEAALHYAHGRVTVYPLDESKKALSPLKFSTHHHCAHCDIDFAPVTSSTFSFNSPIGACETCRGFGRVIGVDENLVIPDETKSLKEGAVKPWQTPSYAECQDHLMEFAKKKGIPVDKPWNKLTNKQKRWVIEGEGDWDDGYWYGVNRFFDWLESKAYKMHIRVLLSKYRSYSTCLDCEGARLKPHALWWRLGSLDGANQALGSLERFIPKGNHLTQSTIQSLPGLTIHDVMRLPLERCSRFFNELSLPRELLDEAAELLLSEIRSRLSYLLEVGLGYLTLDRQSRTLSGGEIQRINLTTALGTSLVNTLFVLDEPSIGLHPRDMNRMVKILHRLRDAGNSLLVVEHDPQVMLAADRILDIGPGPGKQGGDVCFFGSPKELMGCDSSITSDYLSGKALVTPWMKSLKDSDVEPFNNKQPHILVQGAKAHNLKNVSVEIPLHRLVCITGVSGSGKSTLMRDVVYPALCKLKGESSEAAGEHDKILGAELIDDIVLVDQSPIGKTTRSMPVTYVGAFDAIRKLFVAQPLSKERKYTPGTFSFNSGNGRCPTCSGTGFEQVEMQFLSDVYLKCPDCHGKRYRDEILEVKIWGAGLSDNDIVAISISEILELTVSEALHFFKDSPSVLIGLQPLADVGLEYIQLGQAVPTLSGGEAQRLKLAGHLAKHAVQSKKKKATERKGSLFLFDEPTTGLHFKDISVLMKAFQQLIDAGDSLLVIEHNLDVIRAADWLIDIGPEGGDGGGDVIACGTPWQLYTEGEGHTSEALREYEASLKAPMKSIKSLLSKNKSKRKSKQKNCISIHHAREHNLKNIDVEIPRNQFSVISGVSGSGKSTLAFDIVFGEGQRRYLESLNAYARQFVQPASRPDVDSVQGIPPSVAIEQRTSRGGRKSTVATLTEIYHYLRLLFVKMGVQYCPTCDVPIEPQTQASIYARILSSFKNQSIELLAPLVVERKGIYKELAEWANKKGFEHLRVDGELLPTGDWPKLDRYKEHSIQLPVGSVVIKPSNGKHLEHLLKSALDIGNGLVMVLPSDALYLKPKSGRKTSKRSTQDSSIEQLFSTKRSCPSCGKGFDELDPRLFSYNSKQGWCTSCYGTGQKIKGFDEEQTGEEGQWNTQENDESGVQSVTCNSCDGTRLNPIARAVKFKGVSITDIAAFTIDEAASWFKKLRFNKTEQEIVRDLLKEVNGRLKFLQEVGLNYLNLDRSAPTLSGGEAQRIRLASQLGSNLQGACYILDEPTIGLHARDNNKLIQTLRQLQQQGNTVVVVEHDEETIREADHVIDIGPRAGVRGGDVISSGSLNKLLKNKKSLTGQCLSAPMRHPMRDLRDAELRQDWPQRYLELSGVHENNLDDLSVKIPLHQLVCVSGVSGSGKSTLVRSVLYKNLKLAINNPKKRKHTWVGCDSLSGWQPVKRVLVVDQTPIGKTPRSCPATYIGIWDIIRKLFADTVDARLRGYKPGRFSFNAGDGRCSACGGNGMQKIEMNFLPDVSVPCDECHGLRFNQETLMVRYKDKHIGDVLNMNIEEATDFFDAIPSVRYPLQLLQDVGLGYLTLGQQSPTLSGGEAQRIKLVSELSKAKPVLKNKGETPPRNLYILDEPTVGLHMADVDKLLRVLHRLVDAGHSVIVIEHNLDVIAEADWVIDMGPEGGPNGGKIVAQGKPSAIIKRKRSETAKFLKPLLEEV